MGTQQSDRSPSDFNSTQSNSTELKIAVIGGGFAGIGTGVKLKNAGFHHFTIFEQSDGPGGTWWDNHYPGCEVDIPSHAYSFSFMGYDWSGTHAKQPELRAYAQDVIDRFELGDHFCFNTRVTQAVWDDEEQHYTITTDTGRTEIFHAVISCLGFLNVPQYPNWPGLTDFGGPKFHTARWESEHDLSGKVVAFVGTGSTGVQVVPAIAPVVERLYVFQRQPGWVLPKGERDYSEAERRRFRTYPILQKIDRAKLFFNAERRVQGFDVNSKLQREFRAAGLAYIEETIADPATRKAVTPDYPWGCKRPVYSSDFFPTLNRDNVELVPHAVARVTKDGVVDSEGIERKIDVLILGTGFQTTNYLATLEVVGPKGRRLHEVWGDDPRAFLGVTVAGFPNFFMCYGPNTNGGWSIIAQLERQAEVAVRALRRIRRKHIGAIDTRTRAMNRYVSWVDKQINTRASAMEAGCTNYYHSPSGRNVTQWPRSHAPYYLLTKILPPFGLVERPKPKTPTANALITDRQPH